MKILIMNDNKAVNIDGQTIENLEFILSDDIHCINFDTETKKGEIEYKNDFNKTIDNFDYKPFKDLFDLHLKKINPPTPFHIWNEDKQEFIFSKTLENDTKKENIISQLSNIDKEAVRPTRAIKVAELQNIEADINDINKLIELEKQASELREQLNEL